MPVRRFTPTLSPVQVDLASRLAAEWKSPNPTAIEPVILEEFDSAGDLIHVYAVWSEWAQLDREKRGEIIMEAAELVLPIEKVVKITIAMGLTPEEADRFDLNWRDPQPETSRDWFFNTNETNSKGAYAQMFKKSVVALYGYPPGKGEAKLQRPRKGDRVFAYVNVHGVCAVGEFVDDKVFASHGIFHKGAERELHRHVRWHVVLDIGSAIATGIVTGWGYNLPVRETLCRIDDVSIGQQLSRELLKRDEEK